MTIQANALIAPTGVRRWTAVLALLLVVAANGVNSVEQSVYHKVCCLQSKPRRIMFGESGMLLRDWAQLLTGMIKDRPNGDDNCIHVFGLPEDDATFRYKVVNLKSSEDEHGAAQCAKVSLEIPEADKPLTSFIDFPTPELLDEITRRRPRIKLEEGTADFYFRNGRWEIENYTPVVADYRRYYKSGSTYEFEDLDVEGNYGLSQMCRRMKRAFESPAIADAIPRGPLRSKGRGADGKGKSKSSSREGGKVSAFLRQVTDFLLVNSLLAVSNTKYSDLMKFGAMHKLQRTEMPLFSVCAEKITWKPQLPPTGSSSADWLSSNYRFTITGSRHSSFEYRKLNEVNTKDNNLLSQCAILALVGVAEEGFEDLTRQPVDMIFGILTREQMREDRSDYVLLEYANGLESVSAASGVDPWGLLPEKYGTGRTLGQLFKKASLGIEKKGFPEWPQDGHAQAARTSSKRRSHAQSKLTLQDQQAVESALQFLE